MKGKKKGGRKGKNHSICRQVFIITAESQILKSHLLSKINWSHEGFGSFNLNCWIHEQKTSILFFLTLKENFFSLPFFVIGDFKNGS